MKYANTITQADLKALLHYDPETGIFTWVNCRSHKLGSRAGHVVTKGYVSIRIGAKWFAAHRLAIVYMLGDSAFSGDKKEVDHRNRNKADNRWANLRLASLSQNGANRADCNTSTGVRGVTYDDSARTAKPYLVRVRADGQTKFRGRYRTLEEAKAARLDAVTKLHGEFACA